MLRKLLKRMGKPEEAFRDEEVQRRKRFRRNFVRKANISSG